MDVCPTRALSAITTAAARARHGDGDGDCGVRRSEGASRCQLPRPSERVARAAHGGRDRPSAVERSPVLTREPWNVAECILAVERCSRAPSARSHYRAAECGVVAPSSALPLATRHFETQLVWSSTSNSSGPRAGGSASFRGCSSLLHAHCQIKAARQSYSDQACRTQHKRDTCTLPMALLASAALSLLCLQSCLCARDGRSCEYPI